MSYYHRSDETGCYSFYLGGNILIPKEKRNVIAIGGNITNENNAEILGNMVNNFCSDWCNSCCKSTGDHCQKEILTPSTDLAFFVCYRLFFFVTCIGIVSLIILAFLFGYQIIKPKEPHEILAIATAIASFGIMLTCIRDCIKVECKRNRHTYLHSVAIDPPTVSNHEIGTSLITPNTPIAFPNQPTDQSGQNNQNVQNQSTPAKPKTSQKTVDIQTSSGILKQKKKVEVKTNESSPLMDGFYLESKIE